MPKLRVISSFGVGLDKLDLAAAQARGIAVGYTPDVLNDCVADLGDGAAARRRAPRQRGRPLRAPRRLDDAGVASFPLARKVSGAKLGIVGLGRIGQTIAQRAGGFEMDIRYHSRRPVEGAPGGTSPR